MAPEDSSASSEKKISDSFCKDILDHVEVATANSSAAAFLVSAQDIILSSALAETNPPQILLVELDTNLPRTLSGTEPRDGFKRKQESRSLLQYFNSSRNAEDRGPLKVGRAMSIDEELSSRCQSVPLATVPVVPIFTASSNLLVKRINRRARSLEVPLTIRETTLSPQVAVPAKPLSKNKGKAPKLQTKAKKARKLCSIVGHGEGSGSTPKCSQTRVSTPSVSTRIIDEDGTEFVNCSDEETMFVLSEDDEFQLEVTTSLPNPVLKRRQYKASRKFRETWAARLPWAEMTRSDDGLIQGVKCLICSALEKKPKLLKAKYDTLTKHAGC